MNADLFMFVLALRPLVQTQVTTLYIVAARSHFGLSACLWIDRPTDLLECDNECFFLSTWDVPVHSFHPFLSESSERQGNDSDVSLPVGIS